MDWRDSDMWEFIRNERLEINPLYDMGFYRAGCLGCPMEGKNHWRELRLFLTYQRAYI
ncbi:MAG: phosphoadenosine phosphosulfate reductase family protein [Clostridia bacterium]|nr:phosphoadenosine phosphosulfate reductase family protein [Clostridia bacterium]